MGRVVHMKIFADTPPWRKLWDILCGAEAWNGALLTEDDEEVTCRECQRRISEWRKVRA